YRRCERRRSMRFRKYSLGGYEEMRARHRWEVPERYNIARDVCDKHERERLAMIWGDWRGHERRVTFGELQDLSNRCANALEAPGTSTPTRRSCTATTGSAASSARARTSGPGRPGSVRCSAPGATGRWRWSRGVRAATTPRST